ncbi:MAG: hypothetical protein H6812_04025 [Phycisphaeraceae bacterium]|nr:hypothetical protein [Phycisphaerales bacterium]MCB9842404.1 hypothetical protein [Phycisphaeraceae bacterium]
MREHSTAPARAGAAFVLHDLPSLGVDFVRVFLDTEKWESAQTPIKKVEIPTRSATLCEEKS